MKRLLCAGVVTLVLTGCGGVGGSGQAGAELTLLLGGPPTGADAGIFLAVERGFDEAEGVEIDVRGSGDPVRLLRSDRVQAVLLARDDVAASGTVCVMALVQTPEPDRFVCVSRTTLESRRADVVALVNALQRGYTEAGVDPESAVQAVLSARGGLDRETVAAELDAAAGTSLGGGVPFGTLRPSAMPPGDFAYGLVDPISRD